MEECGVPESLTPYGFAEVKFLVPPARATAVQRPDLIRRLKPEARHKLILVSAPAGFGKTTLLSQWAMESEIPVAWVALDPSDNDPGRLFSAIAFALDRLPGPAGRPVSGALPQASGGGLGKAFLPALANRLSSLAAELAIVLDDYHFVEAEAVHDLVRDLIKYLPPRCHLVIASRTMPPLPLPSLRARAQVIELGTEDLRFTRQEIAAFFSDSHGILLSEQQLVGLERHTEGWIASLELMALSLRHANRTRMRELITDIGASQRYMRDYFTNEIFNQQPEGIRTFLLKTAILSRLNDSLCDEVTGDGNSRAILEELHRRNLVLALDETGHWYRYPTLLADYLHGKAERELGAPNIVQLHLRASAWFERLGFIAEALNHALGMTEQNRFLSLIGRLSENINLDQCLTWPHSFTRFSDDVLYSLPELSLNCALTFIVTGHLEAFERPANIAERSFQAAGDRAGLGKVYLYRSVVRRLQGQMAPAIELSQRALEYLPEREQHARALARHALAVAYAQAGRLALAERMMEGVRDTYQASGDPYSPGTATLLTGCIQVGRGKLHAAEATLREMIEFTAPTLLDQVLGGHAFLGKVYYEWNRLDAARRHLLEAVNEEHWRRVGGLLSWGYSWEWDQYDLAGWQVRRRGGSPAGVEVGRHVPMAYCLLAGTAWAQGDEGLAAAAMGKALACAQDLRNERLIRLTRAYRAHLLLRQGRLMEALKWIEEAALAVDGDLPRDSQLEHLILAQVLIAQGKAHPDRHLLAKAIRLLDRISLVAEERGALPDQVQSQALKALACWHQGDRQQALAPLRLALSLAEPHGFVRTFLDAGEPMVQLLAWAAENGVAPGYVSCLLDQSRALASTGSRPPDRVIGANGLSQREIEVLRCVAEGLGTDEIAGRLCLSIHTVRDYIKSVLAKLDARNRVQAVERARTLNLL